MQVPTYLLTSVTLDVHFTRKTVRSISFEGELRKIALVSLPIYSVLARSSPVAISLQFRSDEYTQKYFPFIDTLSFGEFRRHFRSLIFNVIVSFSFFSFLF